MAMQSNQHVKRKFGYLKISWRVQHFWLATSKENWEIVSPVFTARSPRPTSWKMILKPISKDAMGIYLCVYLERLDSDSGPDIVKANWKLSLLNCKKKRNDIFMELESLFKKNHRYGEVIESMDCLLKDFQPFEIDDLLIQCHLIVSSDIDSAVFLRCTDEGLRSLSDDLHVMFRNGYSADVTLRIGDNDIPAHKAILCTRNHTLASIIDRNNETNVIDLLSCNFTGSNSADSTETCSFSLSFVNVDAVERIVDYMYSGRLEEVTNKPSVCLAECAQLLDIAEVIAYYVPDELTLNSTAAVVENVFSWFITKFETRNVDCIPSPPLTEGFAKPEWRLKLYPGENQVKLYAEIICGNVTPQEACLEFGIMDVDQNIYGYKRLSKLVRSGEILGIDDFIKRTHFENAPFLRDGTLRIVFKLRTSTGVPILSSDYTSVTSVTAPPEEHNFKLLSRDIACLFHGGELSDFAIRCDGHVFRVHSCIMAARSDAFPEILKRHSVNENEIDLPNTKGSILRILLTYVYSGTLEQDLLEPHTTHELFLVASYFEIDALISTCSMLLAESNNSKLLCHT